MLRESLPEEIRSGLNWSPDKNFLFLLSVLSPTPPRDEPKYEMEADVSNAAEWPVENPEASDGIEPGKENTNFPELADKEAAVQARNSVVAAWLWRKSAANTRLAWNAIRIDPWCGVIGIDDERGE
jgi:hypothetical protein